MSGWGQRIHWTNYTIAGVPFDWDKRVECGRVNVNNWSVRGEGATCRICIKRYEKVRDSRAS